MELIMKCARKEYLKNIVLILLPLLLLATIPQHVDGSETPTGPDFKEAAKLPEVKKQLLKEEEAGLEQLKLEIEELRQKRTDRLSRLRARGVSTTNLERSKLEVESLRVRLQSAQLDLANEEQLLENSQVELKGLELQLAPLDKRDDPERQAKMEDLTSKQKELVTNRLYTVKHRDILKRRVELVQQRLELAESWHKNVQAVFQKQQEIRHRESLEELNQRLKLRQQKAQVEIDGLRKELGNISGDNRETHQRREILTRRIAAIQGGVELLKTQTRLEEIRTHLSGLKIPLLDLESARLEGLDKNLTALKQIKTQLDPLAELSRSRSQVYQQQWGLVQKQFALKNLDDKSFAEQKKILTTLISDYSALLEDLADLETEVDEDLGRIEAVYGSTVQQSLTARQTLPSDLQAWRAVWVEVAAVPNLLWNYLTGIANKILKGWLAADLPRQVIIALFALVVGAGILWSRRIPVLQPGIADGELRLVLKARMILLNLVKFTIPTLLALLYLAGMCWLLQVPGNEVKGLFLLLLILFLLGLAVRTSELIFHTPLVAQKGHKPRDRQPRIHGLIFWLATGSAVIAIMERFGKLSFLSMQAQVVIDRFSMLLILFAVPIFFLFRRMFLEFITATVGESILTRLLRVVTLALPLTGLVGGLMGLVGYINLAWFVTRQLVFFVAAILCWGVVRDLLKLLLDRLLARLGTAAENHGLPRKVLVRPVEHIFDLLFILLLLWGLAWIFGWNTGTAADGFLKILLNYILFHIGGKPVSLIEIGTALFLLLLFLYLGSLTKHFTFTVLYQKVADRGLRNSLSVFTQYSVLVIGVLVSLNIVGINLSSLTVFAGALGVGIGFGLQNIANNLVSGFIVLAERPVRVDDWVTVGDKEGVVSRIGLRSLRMNTWDNQDVIIPNADLITNPVTNWTLSDDLIRTILMVGVRYQDDPHQAYQVIKDAVSMVPEVSLQKPPNVYLAEFADSSVNFRVEYYSSVKGPTGRWRAKSNVLFAIWDALKDADIGIPFPQQDIYIKELPADSLVRSKES